MKRRPGMWAAIALLVALVMAGCGSDRPASPSQAVAEDPGLIHVHGLGINPADSTLYAATHTGLFAVRDGASQRVLDRFQDAMGFTVVGPDHFLGSGHPDFRDKQLTLPDRRPLVGLVESRDAGRSWQSLSLLGEADFHALEAIHGRVYGYDELRGFIRFGRPESTVGRRSRPVCLCDKTSACVGQAGRWATLRASGWFGEYGDLAVERYPTTGIPRALSGLSKPASGARRHVRVDERAGLWEHE